MEENPQVQTKKLYSLLKHSKQDSIGIAPLRKDGQTLLTETVKANARRIGKELTMASVEILILFLKQEIKL